MADTFFFIATCTHPDLDKRIKCVTVIDVPYSMTYERADFASVDDTDYDNHHDAIVAARAFANAYKMPYILFDSRYDEDNNEKLLPNGGNLIPYAAPAAHKFSVNLPCISFEDFTKALLAEDYMTALVRVDDDIYSYCFNHSRSAIHVSKLGSTGSETRGIIHQCTDDDYIAALRKCFT